MTRIAQSLLFLASVSGLFGCTSARQKVQGDIVRSIHFDGNGTFLSGQNDYQLQGAMEQGDSSFGIATFPLNYLAKPVTLNNAALSRDSYRLETWYAQNGWFDAKFQGWEVHQIRRQSFKRAGMVRLLGHVDPGQPSLVNTFNINGIQGAAQRVFASTIQRTGSLQPGGQFSMVAVEYTKGQMLELFANNGYPYARIEESVRAQPEVHSVDVTFDVAAGIPSRFGEITIEGNQAIDPLIVRETLPFDTGDTFSAKELRRGQTRLFALGTYAIVNVVPDLTDPTRSDVPIVIKLTETRFQTLRLGGGADFQGGNLTPRLATRYRHVHLFDRLIQAELGTSIGYRFAVDGSSTDDSRYTYAANIGISTPRLAGPRWGLTAQASVEQNQIPDQYVYFNPKTSLRVTHRFTDSVSVNFGPSLEVYRILAVEGDDAQILIRSLFGSEFDGTYQLATIDFGFTADWRDDPLDTTRGTYYRAGVRQALPIFAPSPDAKPYVFTDLFGEARTYRRFRANGTKPFTIALRARGQVLISEGVNDDGEVVGVPYPELSFLGGSADLRGFRINQVGPYETVCTYSQSDVADPFGQSPTSGTDLTRRQLPVGGQASALLSAEGRFSLPYGLSFVPFVDTGLLSPSLGQLSPKQIRVAGGVGIRYASLVGPIRVDLAVRPLYAEDRAARAVFGCQIGDGQARGVDLLSTFGAGTGTERNIPFALNLIVTIGQAF